MRLDSDHKQFNWCISGSKNLSISSNDLWDIISTPSNLELFHPFCLKNPIIDWPGLNSIDQIYYHSGLIYERNFINWIDGAGYDLLIGEKKSAKSFVSWRIKKMNQSSTIIISIYPYIYNKGNKVINFLPYFLFIKPTLAKYLESVLNGLKYYCETIKVVQKNQFGSHKIFSN